MIKIIINIFINILLIIYGKKKYINYNNNKIIMKILLLYLCLFLLL